MPNISYCFEPHYQHSLLRKVDATWLGSYTAWILNRAPSGSLAGVTGTKKEACSVREEWNANKNAFVHKTKQSTSRVLDQKWEDWLRDRMRLTASFIGVVIRSVTYPINHSFMVTDAGQLCKTFWTALVGWDSQAFTLGKHPEKHFKRCISISEIAFKNENTLQRNVYQEQWDIIRYQNYWPLQPVLF